MKIFKDSLRFLNMNSVMRAMKGLNEAPERIEEPSRKETGLGRNLRRYRKHRKTINRIAAASRRINRCG